MPTAQKAQTSSNGFEPMDSVFYFFIFYRLRAMADAYEIK